MCISLSLFGVHICVCICSDQSVAVRQPTTRNVRPAAAMLWTCDSGDATRVPAAFSHSRPFFSAVCGWQWGWTVMCRAVEYVMKLYTIHMNSYYMPFTDMYGWMGFFSGSFFSSTVSVWFVFLVFSLHLSSSYLVHDPLLRRLALKCSYRRYTCCDSMFAQNRQPCTVRCTHRHTRSLSIALWPKTGKSTHETKCYRIFVIVL